MRGFSILERNWRLGRAGELDIIALKKDTIHFIEVKSRKATNSSFSGLESVDARKRQKIVWLAQQYFLKFEQMLLSRGILGSSFDVALVAVHQHYLLNRAKITYLENAFEHE